MSAVSELFDRILLLPEDAVITLTFKNETEQKSKRVMLFREKKKYEDRMKGKAAYKAIFISQETNKKEKVYKLHLSTSGVNIDWLASAIITTAGQEKPLGIAIDQLEALSHERLEKLRKEEEESK